MTIKKELTAVLWASLMCVSGCAENIRKASSDVIARHVKHAAMPGNQGASWFAPELHISHYRTLFYGYDTLDYRLATTESAKNKMGKGIFLLIEANYGGDLRHYDFAKFPDGSTRGLNHLQHTTERCQIFNSLISSCLYRDRLSLTLTQDDIEKARTEGLRLRLASATQEYEEIDLTLNYIQGFLKAVE